MLLIVLLALSLACVVLYAREDEDGTMHSVQNAVSGIVAPFKFVGSFGGSLISSAGTAIGDATASESAREALREQNLELSERAGQLERYVQEDQALQEVLDLRDVYGSASVGARVIGRSADAWNRIVTIDKGSDAGIESGYAVTGQSGLIGTVVSTTASTADVRLVKDAQSSVSAMVQSSRVEGSVRGSIGGALHFENMASDATVEEGDVIVSSGLDGMAARGIIIGTVTGVEKNANGATVRATVAPNGEVALMQDVHVVIGAQSEGANAPSAEEAESDGDASSASSLSGLRAENQELRERVARLEEYMQESERLQALVDAQEAYGFESLGARVIGRSSSEWERSITIDRGSDDGLKSGMPVMGQAGLVGMVVSTTSETAKVRLVQDAQSGASAMVRSGNIEGIVRGSVEGVLYFEDMAADAMVNEGDVVITSGIGGSYFKGLVIGTVTKVERNASGSTMRAVVAQSGDGGLLQEVLVVLSMQSEGAASSTFKDPNAQAGASASGSNAAGSNGAGGSDASGSAGTSGDDGGDGSGEDPSSTDPEGDAGNES
ncbi:rod shape-determining protein MreC [Raoultibacter massiliensis]|uniref:Cell shape-determining protein MreC n=1 Tax=Raoultibacter massiliensis TaxID=1852371 RepID=A0ABV1JC90_9ACTN|nr:rod shape-determining protein MreC [Raoultibacter massiliensis]